VFGYDPDVQEQHKAFKPATDLKKLKFNFLAFLLFLAIALEHILN
jgi:hypothetical protein